MGRKSGARILGLGRKSGAGNSWVRNSGAGILGLEFQDWNSAAGNCRTKPPGPEIPGLEFRGQNSGQKSEVGPRRAKNDRFPEVFCKFQKHVLKSGTNFRGEFVG